jgi:hypothetical protein
VVDELLENVLLERVVPEVIDLADDLVEALLDEVRPETSN